MCKSVYQHSCYSKNKYKLGSISKISFSFRVLIKRYSLHHYEFSLSNLELCQLVVFFLNLNFFFLYTTYADYNCFVK